jgi:hypothetical protein
MTATSSISAAVGRFENFLSIATAQWRVYLPLSGWLGAKCRALTTSESSVRQRTHWVSLLVIGTVFYNLFISLHLLASHYVKVQDGREKDDSFSMKVNEA